ncbi:MAG TPA: ABC transporter ATP-binding protein [Devosiaceae bacterium]|jgi:peptide/nickel transport system ATP-binding protein|nr:ABC transporter ATP-binding protein [Devosiaceae bacterium]
MTTPLLELRGLTRTYPSTSGRHGSPLVALDDFSLTIDAERPKIIAIVGESGSGKTTLANLVLGFDKPSAGTILFDGAPLKLTGSREKRSYRRNVQAVFQDPFAAFNPFYRVRHIFNLAARSFGIDKAGSESVEAALNAVGLSGADVLDKHPHQLSGGQRQRIMIARALVVQPRLIVADEPVSMVDASLRSTILAVLERLKQQGISFIYITHDLSTVWQYADEVHVLYRGRLMECGPAQQVIEAPKHPYVRLLVDSVPPLERNDKWLQPVPAPEHPTGRGEVGCPFVASCPHGWELCRSKTPELVSARGFPERRVACHLFDEEPQSWRR